MSRKCRAHLANAPKVEKWRFTGRIPPVPVSQVRAELGGGEGAAPKEENEL